MATDRGSAPTAPDPPRPTPEPAPAPPLPTDPPAPPAANRGDGYLFRLERRRRIYDRIRTLPGIHMRRLARDLSLPTTTLRYHLRHMERRGLLASHRAGRRRSYFVPSDLEFLDQHYLYFLRHRTTRWILLEMLADPSATLHRLAGRLHLAAPTVSYHVAKLVEAGLVASGPRGTHPRYRVTEPERVRRLMDVYGATFRYGPRDRPIKRRPPPAKAVEAAALAATAMNAGAS